MPRLFPGLSPLSLQPPSLWWLRRHATIELCCRRVQENDEARVVSSSWIPHEHRRGPAVGYIVVQTFPFGRYTALSCKAEAVREGAVES